jgi:pimeloyl-ACP methyl ester carboxylesterase
MYSAISVPSGRYRPRRVNQTSGALLTHQTDGEQTMEPSHVDAGDGTRLAVYDKGDPVLPAAVVAHGVGSTARFVREAFAGPLADVGYRLVSYDLRGHGRSDPARRVADHDRRVHASDLGRVVDSVGARIAGGISLGAHAAATWAARSAPDLDGLVLCVPALTGRVAPGEGPHAALAAEVRDVGVAGLLERIASDGEIRPWLAELLLRDWGGQDAESLAAALLSLDGGEGPSLGELARITVPTGVTAWPDDPGHPLRTAESWIEALPQAALVRIALDDVGGDPAVLGRSALQAWEEVAGERSRRSRRSRR